MAKIDDCSSKAANYSSKEPELSEHCWNENILFYLPMTCIRQEDRDNTAANTRLTNLRAELCIILYSLFKTDATKGKDSKKSCDSDPISGKSVRLVS